MLDKKKHSDIVCSNEAEVSKGAAPYYTNSTQLPVNYSDDIFQVLDLQDSLQTRYTGGTVLHLFLGEQATESAVKSADLASYRVVAFATHGLAAGDLDGMTQPALALSSPRVTG